MSYKRYIVFNNDKLVLIKENDTYRLLDTLLNLATKPYLVATKNNIEYFCAEVSTSHALPSAMEWVLLRQACDLLGTSHFDLISKAYQIIQFNKTHRFCSRCGLKIISKRGRHQEHDCANCKLSFYPPIAPSIIVLIKKNDMILMARSPHFAAGTYGLIAGFVEPGESVETAVHREVFEEVGLKINNLRYFGSQSWPFPNALMLGFTADYVSGDIIIDSIEIEAAGWYNINNLPGLPSLKSSISYKMLNSFLNL